MSEGSRPPLMSETPVVFLPREEVSLVDMALVLWRWKVIVVVGLLLGWGWSGWQISRSPVRYESRGVVKIGRSRASFPIKPTKEQQDMLLEPTAVAAMRVREEFGPASAASQAHEGAYVSITAFDKEADELLTIFARGNTPEQAQQYLDFVMKGFVASHQQLFQPERTAMTQRLETLVQQRKKLQGELDVPDTPEGDAALQALRRLTKAQLWNQVIALDQEAVQLTRSIAELQSQPTSVVTPASLSSRAVEPRREWLLILGTGLGLILGMGGALLAEFGLCLRSRLGQRT